MHFAVRGGLATIAFAVTGIVLAAQFCHLLGWMAAHIAIMNIGTPLTALIVASRMPRFSVTTTVWALATASQLLLLVLWHIPEVVIRNARPSASTLLFMIVTCAASIAYWILVLHPSRTDAWKSLASSLLAGKFACLIGLILVFAPRDLYFSESALAALCGEPVQDQIAAGLLMTVACPLSYLCAALASGVTLLKDNDAQGPSDEMVTLAPR